MGKRKRTRKTIKQKKEELKTIFDCPFCFSENSVVVKKQTNKHVAVIMCGNCNVSFQSKYTDLTEPIDIYYEWIDACETANNNSKEATTVAN